MTKKQKTWTWIKNMNMSKKREHEHKFCLTSEDYTKNWLRSKHVKWFKRAVSCRRKCEELCWAESVEELERGKCEIIITMRLE